MTNTNTAAAYSRCLARVSGMRAGDALALAGQESATPCAALHAMLAGLVEAGKRHGVPGLTCDGVEVTHVTEKGLRHMPHSVVLRSPLLAVLAKAC